MLATQSRYAALRAERRQPEIQRTTTDDLRDAIQALARMCAEANRSKRTRR